MYTFIGLTLIVFFVGVVVFLKGKKLRPASGTVPNFLFSAIFSSVLGMLIGGFIAVVGGYFLPTKFVVSAPIELVSFRDGSTISGSFFLGTGSISGHEYYAYYRKQPDGGFVRELVTPDSKNRVVLYEQDRRDSELVVEHEVFAEEWMNKYFVLDKRATIVRIYVPKGTILRNFSTK